MPSNESNKKDVENKNDNNEPRNIKTDAKKATQVMKVKGSELVGKIKELLHEGNIRKIRIKKDDKVVMEVPLMIGSIGIVLAPVVAAVGGLAAVLTECTIEVVREEK